MATTLSLGTRGMNGLKSSQLTKSYRILPEKRSVSTNMTSQLHPSTKLVKSLKPIRQAKPIKPTKQNKSVKSVRSTTKLTKSTNTRSTMKTNKQHTRPRQNKATTTLSNKTRKISKSMPKMNKVSLKSTYTSHRTKKMTPLKTTKKEVEPTKIRRPHNIKPTTLDVTGIGIGPARVKAVLINEALNPREFAVRKEILRAENRSKRPRPTNDNPNPETPEQGPQIPLKDLPKDVQDVINEAEEHYKSSLYRAYENDVLSEFDDDTKNRYMEQRKNALEQSKQNSNEFNLIEFNKQFNPTFYDNFETWREKNDHYANSEKYNEWTRANALVNKLCTRLSGHTRNIIASFLDCIVEQYANNGIHNCLLEERHIVQLRHALLQTEGFESRVLLHRFVSSFDQYDIALNWIEELRQTKLEVKALRDAGQEVEFMLPSYPELNVDYEFEGYVSEICRSVKMRLAMSQTKEDVRSKYLNTSVSREFKKFCSYLVHEAIVRIGRCLRTTIDRLGVKTISDQMVLYILKQIHNVCGMNWEETKAIMDMRLEQFINWRVRRREERRRQKKLRETSTTENKNADDADDEADETDKNNDSENKNVSNKENQVYMNGTTHDMSDEEQNETPIEALEDDLEYDDDDEDLEITYEDDLEQ